MLIDNEATTYRWTFVIIRISYTTCFSTTGPEVRQRCPPSYSECQTFNILSRPRWHFSVSLAPGLNCFISVLHARCLFMCNWTMTSRTGFDGSVPADRMCMQVYHMPSPAPRTSCLLLFIINRLPRRRRCLGIVLRFAGGLEEVRSKITTCITSPSRSVLQFMICWTQPVRKWAGGGIHVYPAACLMACLLQSRKSVSVMS